MKNDFSIFSGKKVLVTGATGFIGPHLCKKLAGIGAEVIGVSRKIADDENKLPENVKYLKIDFSHLNTVRELFNKYNPDFVFHLAGLAAGGRDVDLIEPTFESNLVTAINTLIVVNEQKTSRLIITGSMEEPDPGEKDFVPSSPYAASKWAASSYARMFHQLYNTNLVIARLFMTYGPGNQPEKKLLPYLINCLLEGRSPKLSSGNRQIDWIYIDDVVNGLLSLAECPGIAGETFDIGSGSLISTKEFVEMIHKIVGSNVELQFSHQKDRLNEQVKKSTTDSTFQKTGWKQTIDLKKGLQMTIDWYKEQKELATR